MLCRLRLLLSQRKLDPKWLLQEINDTAFCLPQFRGFICVWLRCWAADDGSPINPRELNLEWLRSHFDAGVPPPLTKPRLQVKLDEDVLPRLSRRRTFVACSAQNGWRSIMSWLRSHFAAGRGYLNTMVQSDVTPNSGLLLLSKARLQARCQSVRGAVECVISYRAQQCCGCDCTLYAGVPPPLTNLRIKELLFDSHC